MAHVRAQLIVVIVSGVDFVSSKEWILVSAVLGTPAVMVPELPPFVLMALGCGEPLLKQAYLVYGC